MKSKEEILNIVDTKGFYWTVPVTSETELLRIDDLVREGELVTLKSLNISFMNEGWCFLRPGNPLSCHVVTKDGRSWLTIGN